MHKPITEIYVKIGIFRNNKMPWLSYWISIPAFTWIMLWFGINTGPGVLKHAPDTFIGYLHYTRTVFPYFLLFVGVLIISSNPVHKIFSGPVTLWLIYGLTGFISGWISSPRPFDATYWAIVYISAFVILKVFLQGKEKLNRAIYLNYLSWIITSVFLAILVLTARDVLFVDTRWGLSGYGVVSRVGTVADTAMSRSSGMARFASVPALAAFVYIWSAKGLKRLFWAIVFVIAIVLVYLMQSRGAILGLGFSLGFVMIFLGTRTQIIGIVLSIIFISMIYTEIIPEQKIELEKQRFYRGMSKEQLRTLTGRTIVWEHAWQKIKQSPILGYGPQSDRYLLKAHVHNTYLYALLQSGIIGFATFVGGVVWAWILFWRALLRGSADRLGQREFLIQAGGILSFFTVRSIPEVCGAMFGVDFMVMLPILGYLGILDKEREYENVRG